MNQVYQIIQEMQLARIRDVEFRRQLALGHLGIYALEILELLSNPDRSSITTVDQACQFLDDEIKGISRIKSELEKKR